MTTNFEDTHAIQRLKHEYCYAIDDGRYEDWASLFTEDGRFVRANGDTFVGRDELREFAEGGFHRAFECPAHIVTNPVIDVDGDEATGRWYLLCLHRTDADEPGWVQARYDDEYRRVGDEWKIAEAAVTVGLRSHPV